MRKRDSDRFDARDPARKEDQRKLADAKVFRLEEVQNKKKEIDEGKHIKAILDLVRHYK